MRSFGDTLSLEMFIKASCVEWISSLSVPLGTIFRRVNMVVGEYPSHTECGKQTLKMGAISSIPCYPCSPVILFPSV